MSRFAKTLLVVAGLGSGYALIRYLLDDDEPAQDERSEQAAPAPQSQAPAQVPQSHVPGRASAPIPDNPGKWPATPLPEPKHPNRRQRLNRSTTDEGLTVVQSADELLRQARRIDPDITLDELTAARLAMSEHGSGTFTELCCIIDSELNRAKRRRKSLFESLTYRGTFGRQGKYRRASTRQDPTMRHLLAARAVLSGKARGVSRGARQFFDPLGMVKSHRKFIKWHEAGRQGKAKGSSCDALSLLEAWSFDYGKKSKYRCPPDRSRSGGYTLAWVGPIDGVDATRLMLMKRLKVGPEHTQRYEAARDLLQRRLPKP